MWTVNEVMTVRASPVLLPHGAYFRGVPASCHQRCRIFHIFGAEKGGLRRAALSLYYCMAFCPDFRTSL